MKMRKQKQKTRVVGVYAGVRRLRNYLSLRTKSSLSLMHQSMNKLQAPRFGFSLCLITL